MKVIRNDPCSSSCLSLIPIFHYFLEYKEKKPWFLLLDHSHYRCLSCQKSVHISCSLIASPPNPHVLTENCYKSTLCCDLVSSSLLRLQDKFMVLPSLTPAPLCPLACMLGQARSCGGKLAYSLETSKNQKPPFVLWK